MTGSLKQAVGLKARLSPNLIGALWMLASAVSFTGMTVLVKFLGNAYSPGLQTFYRSLVTAVVLLPWILRDWRAAIITRSAPMLIFRSATGTLALVFAFYSFQHLPLGEANALSFTRALWIVPLAALLIKEPVGLERIIATLVGFVGALIMIRPGSAGAHLGWGEGLALASSFLFAFTVISIKFMSRDNSPLTLIVWGTGLGLIFSLPLALISWRWPTFIDLMLLVAMGILGVINQICYIKGMHIGDAAAMAPVDYTRLVFALIIGMCAFHEKLDAFTLCGAAVIVTSTLFIFWRENATLNAPV